MYDDHEGLKLLLTYNLQPDQVNDYRRFMLGRYVPSVQALGLEMADAFHTAYGDHPNRLIVFVARDRETMDSVINNEAWEMLNEQMARFVTEFTYKIVPFREGFQI